MPYGFFARFALDPTCVPFGERRSRTETELSSAAQPTVQGKKLAEFANIIRCLWSCALLINLHFFVDEPVNPVHIFHDAHTNPFCLTADHISTCLCVSSLFQASTVLVFFVHVEKGRCSI